MAAIDLTTTPQKLADADADFLISFGPTARANTAVIAMTDTEGDLTGADEIELRPCQNESLNRAVAGPGHAYGYVRSNFASVTARVKTWTA